MEAPRKPLIAVIGTTGVGKSRLAIELALSLQNAHATKWRGAKVINADAMQAYRGADIITNKVTEDEMQGVKHHLLSIKELDEEYVIGEWVKDAIKLIDEAHAENLCPIIVGGTTYWIQHLLFPNRLTSVDTPARDKTQSGYDRLSPELKATVDGLAPELQELFRSLPPLGLSAAEQPDLAFLMHSLLTHLDPVMASRWHWKDTRKVLRSLQIIQEQGRRASEVITDQDTTGVQARYDSLVFWLYANPETLNQRLDERVDQMLHRGLLNEIRSLQDGRLKSGSAESANYTEGIYQVIGYKEFHEYLSAPEPSSILFDASLDSMKHATRKYAQYQVRWIRQRTLPVVKEADTPASPMPLVLLDTTDVSSWSSVVHNPADQAMRCFLSGQRITSFPPISDCGKEMLKVSQRSIEPSAVLAARRKRPCLICSDSADRLVLLEEEGEWEKHLNGRSHHRAVAKRKREQILKEKGTLRREPSRQKIRPEVVELEEVGMEGFFEREVKL